MSLAAITDVPDMQDYAFDWALVDVETSGLRPGEHRVLSVAVVTVGPMGELIEEFSTLLDPGCDPGPVHIHGLTAERLRGAPTFAQVADRIGAMLQGRVMVAHNAQFDYDFLAREFALAGVQLPVSRRLCTLALNRRVAPPTPDLRLGTLAAHYGVAQQHAHDALDDTRVLAGILRGTLKAAARLGLSLPLVTCPPRQQPRIASRTPRTPCAYRNPGRLPAGGPLVQGMKIAVTGGTAVGRGELTARAAAAGLNMTSSVSRHSSVLVSNDRSSGSAKARRAAAEGVPVLDETAFLRLLDDVRPGVPHEESAGAPAPAPAPAPRQPRGATSAPARAGVAGGTGSGGPLAGRRVLVLGGTHPQAAAARTRVVELGGAAAVNLSANVTDVLLLPGADSDRRLPRIVALDVPLRDTAWLSVPAPALSSVPAEPGPLGQLADRPAAALVLPRGAVIDLPVTARAARWTIAVSWAQQTDCAVDVVAFTVDEDEQVSCDEDFVFHRAPESPDGAVRLSTDGPAEQAITLDLAALPAAVRKVAIAAAVDGAATFGDVGAVEITAAHGDNARVLAQAALDAATTERTLLLAEIYRRGPTWRFRAVGQGYDHGLETLARGYGVDVED
ncbi:TerD family protein [Streptomyces sp. H27-D2]|uniref:TerD family protein n=1 Tax=Streptomyces sp. H27-D2 TaxID=3046304 RepID=UPI002DBFB6DB|nr:TerD family protein [Streptomyces sp. H27-D2]MEC4018630.1 TerD family protein [Streptomyces sp. H27-D2]